MISTGLSQSKDSTPRDPRSTIFVPSELLWLTICQTLVKQSSSLYTRPCTFPTYPIIWYLSCSYGWMMSSWMTNRSSWLKIWLQRIMWLLWQGTTLWINCSFRYPLMVWHQSSICGSQLSRSMKHVHNMNSPMPTPNTTLLILIGLSKKLLFAHGLPNIRKQGTVFLCDIYICCTSFIRFPKVWHMQLQCIWRTANLIFCWMMFHPLWLTVLSSLACRMQFEYIQLRL